MKVKTAESCFEGIILKGIGGFYYVSASGIVYECRARGIFRKDGVTPLTGDRAVVRITDAESKTGSIEKILPRRNSLVRPAVANIDTLAVVMSVKSPEPDYMLLDKLILSAEVKEIEAVVCINKIDLDKEGRCKEIEEIYRIAGYKTVLLDSTEQDECVSGFTSLYEILAGKFTVFAGQSGVGKSTIINRLISSGSMQTGILSARTDKGRHTTRHVEIIEIKGGGFVADTPGFSCFEQGALKPSRLWEFYPEFAAYEGKCRFTGCAHMEEPGCAVRKAVETGLADTGRYARYKEIFGFLKKTDDNRYKQ